MRHRGEDRCIFDSNDSSGGFCSWNESVWRDLDTGESIDRIEICNACSTQSLLRSVSFIGTQLKGKSRD